MVVLIVFLGVGLVGLLAGLPWQRRETELPSPGSEWTACTAGAALLDTLEQARETAARDLLPPHEAVVDIAWRLQVVSERVGRIDGLLLLPEFSPGKAAARVLEHAKRGDRVAMRLAGYRASRLRRLVSLRERLASELEELRELVVQLRAETEACAVAEASGSESGGTATRLLVQEVLTRMERLGGAPERFPELPQPPHPRLRSIAAHMPTPRRLRAWKP